MRITPLDIRKQEFKKVMRGLDADEVYAFLNTVAEEYEAVLSDNKNLRERLVAIEERLNEFKSIETNLRNTLLTAEKLTQEAKESARREASLIVRQAEMEAEKASEGIRAHTSQLRREILELKKNKDNYLARLKTLIESHARMIDGYAEDFAGVDNAIEKIGRQVEEDASRPPAPPRMSRDKITQDFGHEPKDKVTWGDEPRPEEEQRPQMPRPGIERNDQPSQRTKPPENANIFAAPRTVPMAAPAPAPEVTAAAPERPAPSAAAEQPQSQVSRDDWRGYEVRKEAVDWKSYVIPEGAAARRAAPVDAELDNALSSLKEAAAGVEDVAPPRPEPRQAPSQAAPQAPPQAAPQAPPQAAQQNAPQAPRPRPEPVSAEAASEQSWSMDELRRNLTNLSKDEGHKG
jgi:cell division initiation protein